MGKSEILRVLLGRADTAKLSEPPIPDGFRACIPFEDDDEVGSDVGDGTSVADEIGVALGINYVDSKGNQSSRRISVRTVIPHHDDYLIRAWCYERLGPRCFRAARIKQIIDLSTGEVFDKPIEILERIALIYETEIGSREGAAVQILRQARPALNVLVFLARCDGEFHSSEEDVVIHYLLKRFFELDFDEDVVLQHISRLHPDPEVYRKSVNRLVWEGQDEVRTVLEYAVKLIEADGTITSEEANFVAELQHVLH